MTLTYRASSFGLLASLAAVPLLVACPGGNGDLGDHGSSTGASSGIVSTGPGPTTGGPASTGNGSTADPGTTNGDTGVTTDGTAGSSTGDAPCTKKECGPAPGIPNFPCQDGVTVGGPGPCERDDDGMCGYPIVECPACCYEAEEPQCFEGSTCCDDGTWACNDGQGNPTCEAGSVCACCDPADAPQCFEGASCCAGGGWACNDEQGNSTCEVAGVECDLPPPPPCCEPVDEPQCFEGSICCEDGTWGCNNPGQPPPCPPTGEICGGGMCSNDGDSCANGETCCANLQCCVGVPVPPGQEFCSNNCPISDRNRKENFATIDTSAILEKLVALPISTWNYKFEDASIRHLGPMAQDFKAAFEVGRTDKLIFQIDADGVALASIQALNGEVEGLRADNAELRATLAAMQARLETLEKATPAR